MCIHCMLIVQAKMQTEINNNSWIVSFWPIGTAEIIRIVFYPIRKKSRFWLFCMWSVKGLYHALLLKTIYRDKGRRHDCWLGPSIQSCIFIFIYTIISSGGLVVLRGEGQKKKAYRGEFVRGNIKKINNLI